MPVATTTTKVLNVNSSSDEHLREQSPTSTLLWALHGDYLGCKVDSRIHHADDIVTSMLQSIQMHLWQGPVRTQRAGLNNGRETFTWANAT